MTVLSLDHSNVHLWSVQTEDARRQGWLVRYAGLLFGDHLKRHQRFVFKKDRDQFLIAHALVRTTLSRYAPVPPEAWRFQTNEFGKPEVDSSQNSLHIRYNISHCEGLVLCGVTVGREIGVDCENVNRKVEIEKLASRVFAASEHEYLAALPEALQTETFFRFWTLKEAYVKARGLGMLLPLQHFSFDLDAKPDIQIAFHSRIQDQSAAWQFFQPQISSSFIAAVAVNNPGEEKLRLEIFNAGLN